MAAPKQEAFKRNIRGRLIKGRVKKMSKRIQLSLTRSEAKAIVAGLKSALDFSCDYYMFAPKDGDYNQGNGDLCLRREAIASGVIDQIENLLGL